MSLVCFESHEKDKFNYKLTDIFGTGRFSVVYKAIDIKNNKNVAMKIISLQNTNDEKVKSDCLNEIQILKNLKHENIIELYNDFLTHHNELILVLEAAEYGDLANEISLHKSQHKLIPECIILKYFNQICLAISYLHEKKIIHRDIKPANILLKSCSHIKIADLGFSKFFNCKTSADSFLGTPFYMSPERLKQLHYSYPSDIWSLGCLLYELAALQSPFFGENTSLNGLSKRIEMGIYSPLPTGNYSLKLKSIIFLCLSPTPAIRPNCKQLLFLIKQD